MKLFTIGFTKTSAEKFFSRLSKANVKKLVEAGGATMDSIVQLTVFLAKIDDYDGMNKVFKTYFPHGGPARTTVAVAALPGNSLVEINCVAALPKK